MPRYKSAASPMEMLGWGVNSILNILAKLSGDFGADAISREDFLNQTKIYRNGVRSRRKFSQTIYKMKSSGYLLFEDESIIITNKTKMKVVDKFKLQSANNYRLVSFDIPEKLKNNRNLFRRAIKRMGFKQIQKSLWVSNKKLGDLVEIAAKEYGVSGYVAYFISGKSNIEQHIKDLLTKEK